MQNISIKARWVVPPSSERIGNPVSNEWFLFRTRMTVTEPSSSVLKIAADSKYWLYVNGQIVVREGGLKRGPVPDGSYFDEVDVSGLVKKGENTIAVLLWYFGRHGFSHRDSGSPGLLVDAGSAQFSAWKVKKHPAYFDAGYIHDAFRLSENSIGFDARRDLPGWTGCGFDDAGWPSAEVSGKAGAAPWGPLEKREFPQWFWSDLKEYESVKACPSAAGDGYMVYHCKLPHNAHFVPALTVRAKAGVRIDITVAQDTNRLAPSYITAEGEQMYECIGWMNGEEVIYKVPSDAVKMIGLTYRETGYPAEFAGSFSCGEGMLNKLWGKARRTLYVTMRDTFMDCPCRERAQWPGDMVVQLGQVPYCLGRGADLLVKKGLRETLRWQREDGVIYGPVPEGNWRMELPAQMLAVVSPYGIWTYYMNTADRQTLAELYPFAKRYLDVWEFEKSGLIKYRPDEKGAIPKQVNGVSVGTWDWIDWGERIDAVPALNAWFVLASQGVRRMAEELGLQGDAREIQRKEEQVIAAVRRTFWNETKGGYCSAEFEYDPDDRVQALMVLCGAATPDQYLPLKCILETVEQACPYMEKYVLEALFKIGEAEAALSRMQRRYKGLVENENSTLWERWPEWSKHPGTINHSWSGGPLTLLSEVVAGIRPLEAGWKRFSLYPCPGALTQFAASVSSPCGEIRISAQKSELEWTVEVKVPDGAVATADFSYLGDGEVPGTIRSGSWTFTVTSKNNYPADVEKLRSEKETVCG
jgi:alpha-L-rhamnosidase